MDLGRPVEQLPVTPPLRILGMVANPSDLRELDVDHERTLVEEATKVLQEKGLVELTWLEEQTWSALQEAMWGGPWHIFHFVGHGDFDRHSGEGRVAFSDETGRPEVLPARKLARLLDDHSDLRLAFLNSCEGARGSEGDPFSGTAATLVRRGVPAVLAMQYEITDNAAIAFSRGFYHAVANNLPVDAAVAAARTAVSMYETLEWGTPVLYMRSPDGCLFDIEKEERVQEGPLRQYREDVERSLASGELRKRGIDQLRNTADSELGLSTDTAADIELEVMGETKEAFLKHQSKEKALRRYREAVEWTWTDKELYQRDVSRLRKLANQLNVNASSAAVVECEVMGETKEALLQRQEPAARESARQEQSEALKNQQWAETEPEATEAAKRKAEELGVDLSQVEGSGANGRIVVKDVLIATNQKTPIFRPIREELSADRTLKLPTTITESNAPEVARLRTLEGHTQEVHSVAFSPDGRMLASGSGRYWGFGGERTVRLWSVEGWQLLHTLEGHTKLVKSVAFSRDGQLLASSSKDQTVSLWGIAR